MSHALIPAFYFPTTTVIVASQDHIAQYESAFGKSGRYFSSSKAALDFINSSVVGASQLANACFSEHNEYTGFPLQNHMMAIDITELHRHFNHPTRYQEVSVVIAETKITGLEFFAQIKNSQVKKIALGCEPQQYLWLQAFCQEKLVDHCLDHPWQIQQANATMQLRYFQEHTYLLSKMLSYGSASCLEDEKFSRFFYQLCAKYTITEYYLIENTGSFLLQDAKGKFKTLIVKTQSDLCWCYELAQDAGAPGQVLEQLAKGQGLLAWQPNLDSDFAIDTEWSINVYPCHRIEGKKTYFYSLIDIPTPASWALPAVTTELKHMEKVA